jgi:hypothetical protein
MGMNHLQEGISIDESKFQGRLAEISDDQVDAIGISTNSSIQRSRPDLCIGAEAVRGVTDFIKLRGLRALY